MEGEEESSQPQPTATTKLKATERFSANPYKISVSITSDQLLFSSLFFALVRYMPSNYPGYFWLKDLGGSLQYVINDFYGILSQYEGNPEFVPYNRNIPSKIAYGIGSRADFLKKYVESANLYDFASRYVIGTESPSESQMLVLIRMAADVLQKRGISNDMLTGITKTQVYRDVVSILYADNGMLDNVVKFSNMYEDNPVINYLSEIGFIMKTTTQEIAVLVPQISTEIAFTQKRYTELMTFAIELLTSISLIRYLVKEVLQLPAKTNVLAFLIRRFWFDTNLDTKWDEGPGFNKTISLNVYTRYVKVVLRMMMSAPDLPYETLNLPKRGNNGLVARENDISSRIELPENFSEVAMGYRSIAVVDERLPGAFRFLIGTRFIKDDQSGYYSFESQQNAISTSLKNLYASQPERYLPKYEIDRMRETSPDFVRREGMRCNIAICMLLYFYIVKFVKVNNEESVVQTYKTSLAAVASVLSNEFYRYIADSRGVHYCFAYLLAYNSEFVETKLYEDGERSIYEYDRDFIKPATDWVFGGNVKTYMVNLLQSVSGNGSSAALSKADLSPIVVREAVLKINAQVNIRNWGRYEPFLAFRTKVHTQLTSVIQKSKLSSSIIPASPLSTSGEEGELTTGAASAASSEEVTTDPFALPSSPLTMPDNTTHTAAVEMARRPVSDFVTTTAAGIKVSERQRPPDQLVSSMLGTACKGDKRAPGCYHIDGTTNVPCTDPEKAIKGECNFKTIAVPHENPIGNSDVFKVYRSLDIGTQIKLQLQRAMIRYGYASAIFPVYCPFVLDRHFSVIQYQDLIGRSSAEKQGEITSLADSLGHTPKIVRDSYFTENRLIVQHFNEPKGNDAYETIYQHLWSISARIPDRTRETRALSEMMNSLSSTATAFMQRGAGGRLSSSSVNFETISKFAKTQISPHYARIIPQDDTVSDSIRSSFPGIIKDQTPKDNVFMSYPSTPPHARFVSYPVWFLDAASGKVYPNKSYINERYLTEGLNEKMLRKARGMLLRAMQHAHNALLLYIIANTSLEGRKLGSDSEIYRKLIADSPSLKRIYDSYFIKEGGGGGRQQSEDVAMSSGGVGGEAASLSPAAVEERIPRGSLAFLTEADKNFMYSLILMLKSIERTASTTSEIQPELPSGENILSIHPSKERNVEWSATEKVGSTAYKLPLKLTDRNLSSEQTDRITTVCYLESLFSYWFTNNSIGRIRKRMNFRAKLETIPAVVTGMREEKEKMRTIMSTIVAGNILNPSWEDAALAGLVLAHLYVQRDSINSEEDITEGMQQLISGESPASMTVESYIPSQ